MRTPLPRVRSLIRGLVAGAIIVAVALGWDASRQPAAGRDWRLVGQQRGSGDPTRIVVLEEAADLGAAWKTLRLRGDPVAVDFDQSIIFWLTSVGTIGCPSRLDGVRIDRARATVDVMFSRGLTLGCDIAVVPDSFLVRIDRKDLPAVRYLVRVVGPHPPDLTPGGIELDP